MNPPGSTPNYTLEGEGRRGCIPSGIYGALYLLALSTSTATGSKCEYRVVQKLSSRLRNCPCMQQLLPHLKAHGILTEEDCAVLRRSGGQVSEALVGLLVQSSYDPSRSEKLIQGIYLSLLDCYEKEVEAWCWDTAVHILQPVG